VGERVQVAQGVSILVCEVHGKTVRLGFEAPREISIVREEVLKRATDQHGWNKDDNTNPRVDGCQSPKAETSQLTTEN